MEYILTNNKNSFKLTRKLRSSHITNSFIPFDKNKDKCDCGNEYSETLLFNQKFCKNCLSEYIKNVDNNNTYLNNQYDYQSLFSKIFINSKIQWITIDVNIYTDNSIQCNNHKSNIKRSTDLYNIQEFQEWCDNCSKILYFKQIVNDYLTYSSHIEDNCKLCGKVMDQHILLCSDCYQISSKWIKLTLTENPILIIYLP